MKRLAVPLQLFLVCVAAAIGGCHDSGSAPANSPVFITGTVTGLVGTAVLQNDGRSLTVTANGKLSFNVPITAGSAYAVTVITQPAGQTCTVNNGSGTTGTANITDVALVCVGNTQTLGGTVSGLSGSLVLQDNGGAPLSITANGAFTFPTAVADNSPYAVTVRTQPADQTCMVSNGSGIVATASITNITVACIANAFTTGGAISGLTGTLVLQNNGGDAQTISTDGAFTFPTPIDEGSPYLVTVKTQPAAQTCSVANGAGTMGAARVTNVAVVCATNTYTTGGMVSGLTGTVVLQDNGADSQSISSIGSFTFATPIAQGGTYMVTVLTQPATQTCTVANGSGIVGSANVTNVTVVCSTNAYTVGGTVSGLSGALTLQDNGSNSLLISTNGSFTFSTPIAEGSPYNVTVATQPVAQTCIVTNGSGTLGGFNVTNVVVNCVSNNTTISVSATGVIPVNVGPGGITVTNTGVSTAYNVSATLPGGWSRVSQDSSDCATIAPNGGTCTLSFTSTTPYVAQGNITISGDNITSPPTTALAFAVDDYLVYAVPTASTAMVVANTDAGGAQMWSMSFDNIPGITETSVAPPCDGATDGNCDTDQIAAFYGTPYSNYAAGLCDEITSDNSGSVPLNTWYLPAICELASTSEGANCPVGIANIDTNLVQLGFTSLADYYWSSTEYSAVPLEAAWAQFFQIGGSLVVAGNKSFELSTRCVRQVSY
jgi:hypothetical protein